MNKKRLIGRIDVKNEHVIKGIHLEGLRKVGNPNDFAKKYYDDGIDEIIFMDAVAAYYDRNSLSHIIEKACECIFVPITVGGGIRTIADIKNALNSGADKVAINTQAIHNPSFITEASRIFGSQCIVASIVAKKVMDNSWEAYIENGREPTGKNVVEWAQELQKLGAGEIMLTSLDHEGTKRGFEVNLYQAVINKINIPIIASGGMGTTNDAINLLNNANVDAVAVASVLHYNLESISTIKKEIKVNNIKIRI
ncbi:imidazole glycerol phosphate synthase subunit HisF [bacterium]|nr:imidazole glycerol phosphate synthase subunit HisF [bacterium]|tara:strand:- start:593 stop:1351 length:759 start_codon:yes stop_codon:yes gene_type:complete